MMNRMTLWFGCAALAVSLFACAGDPEAGDDCSFQETGDIFCGPDGAVLECTFVNAERQWTQVATCSDGTTCQEDDSVAGFVCE